MSIQENLSADSEKPFRPSRYSELYVRAALELERKVFPRPAEFMLTRLLSSLSDSALSFGFVFCLKPYVYGWVEHTVAKSARFVVRVNGAVVAEGLPETTTVFHYNGRSYSPIKRSFRDVWRYVGEGDTVSVELNGRRLPFVRGQTLYAVDSGKSRFDDMLAKLSDGYIFTKDGRFIPSLKNNEVWKAKAFGHFENVAELVRKEFGYQLFPTFGVMLGAVREGDIIAHDNDIDVTYVSRHSERDLVVGEFIEICRFLSSKGLAYSLWKNCAKIIAPDKTKLDLFYSWFNDEGGYRISYGFHGPEVRRSPAFSDFKPYPVGNRTILLPANAPDQLLQLYGPGWRVPNPGFFHSKRTLKFDPAFLLSYRERALASVSSAVRERLYWDRYYNSHSFQVESSFARFVAGYIDDRPAVVEIGSGEGRDAVYFARAGYPVIAIDRSESGIKRAQERAEAVGLPEIQFHRADVAHPEQLTAVLQRSGALGRAGSSLLVYMRFFLHSIPLTSELALFDALSPLPAGTRLAVEFRTDQDENRVKVESKHYRRYIRPAEFKKRLAERGYDILFEEEGLGLSIYGQEDPHLCRIIARKTAMP